MTAIVVLTDRRQADAAGHRLVDVVGAALAAGADAVLLRDKDLPPIEREALARDLRRRTAASGALLIVAGDAALAARCGADGVHLAAADPWPGAAAAGLPVPGRGRPGGVSRSCHTEDDLRAAADQGAAWATYSPVFRTTSKPGYGPPLGTDGLAAAHRAVPDLPLAALGGVDHTNAAACVAAGAGLVAVMGAVMAAADPGAEVAALRAAVDRPPAPTGALGRAR